MTLQVGTRLAHYEIVEPIGKGGMGKVYRAKDSKLGRDVAIKVLPEEFSQDQECARSTDWKRSSCPGPGLALVPRSPQTANGWREPVARRV